MVGRSSISLGRRFTILLAIVGLVIGGSILGVDAHPADAHKIHACVRKTTGAVRIVDVSETCTLSETPRVWIEDVEAGSGLIGVATTGKLTLSVNTNEVQSRVKGTCGDGSSIRVVNGDGSVVCEPDTDTTYSAGPGLTLSDNQLSVNFAGSGTAETAARSDHGHPGGESGQFRVRKTMNQLFSEGAAVDGVYKTITFQQEDFDESSSFDLGTSRFVAGSDGFYLIGATVIFRSDPGHVELVLARNSLTHLWLDRIFNGTDIIVLQGSDLLFLQAGDSVELLFWTNAPNVPHVLAFNPFDADENRAHTTFWGFKVG